MPQFTLEDLKRVLREAAGEDESVDLDGGIMDTEFGELGYDSLANFNRQFKAAKQMTPRQYRGRFMR